MSLNATFHFTGAPPEGLQVIQCRYGFGQTRDDVGRPNSIMYGSNIALRQTPTADNALESWMLDEFELRDGSVVFTRTDSEGVFKELTFQKAYCRRLYSSFDGSGRTKMPSLFVDVFLSPNFVEVDGCRHENTWE